MSYDLEDMRDQLEGGDAQLFDVREQDEWDAGHLVQAKFIPLSDLREGILPDGLDKSKKTYLHCRSGKRVMMAAPILASMGFQDVTPLQEGFEDLMAEGFSVQS